jgi:hypothetical protein
MSSDCVVRLDESGRWTTARVCGLLPWLSYRLSQGAKECCPSLHYGACTSCPWFSPCMAPSERCSHHHRTYSKECRSTKRSPRQSEEGHQHHLSSLTPCTDHVLPASRGCGADAPSSSPFSKMICMIAETSCKTTTQIAYDISRRARKVIMSHQNHTLRWLR